jgi:ankyrin repeat protein
MHFVCTELPGRRPGPCHAKPDPGGYRGFNWADTSILTAIGQIPRPSFEPRAVKTLVANGANVNVIDPRGHSCLARAVEDLGVLEFLLQNGAVVTYSAFESAIESRRPDVIKALIIHGGDPNIRQTQEERERAEEVATQASLTMAKVWPKGKDEGLAVEDFYPVHLVVHKAQGYDEASIKSHREMIQAFLDHGANPNATYPKTTVMHRVIQHGRYARMFLNHPSLDLEARDEHGHTLLHTAFRFCPRAENSRDSVESLPHPVDILLDRGADIHARSADGSTAIHHLIARSSSHGENTKSLLRRVALAASGLLDVRNDEGQTPLHKALRSGYCGDAEALISLGTDVLTADPEGNTPIHLLMRWCEWRLGNERFPCVTTELSNKLVSLGADVNTRNAAGETPLFLFFFRSGNVHIFGPRSWEDARKGVTRKYTGSEEVAVWELFDAAGMDWGAVSAAGETLSHAVVLKWRRDQAVEWFRMLMGRGLNPLAEDARQRTPLDVAAMVGAK